VASSKLNELPTNKVLTLDNATCPYCGKDLLNNNDTKEHVVGRKFCPKGSLNGQWNLILRACNDCNNAKSKLENDISAITLAGRHWFNPEKHVPSVLLEAKRKSKNSISCRTKKPVQDSQENLNISFPFSSGVTFNFNIVGPPQIDNNRLYELARMQIMAFFYLITFNQETKKGGFWLGGFFPLIEAQHSDWGNTIHKAFMQTVYPWELKWIGNTANGFFKSIIKRNPNEFCWSWALEWNKNYRLIGFFGEQKPIESIVNTFSTLEMSPWIDCGKSKYRIRYDISLRDEEDLLFSWDDGVKAGIDA